MSSPMKFSGSCLCGGVRYEVNGEPKRFYHCHCQRCRKASGTGHASNIMVASIDIAWVSGGELVESYKMPEAERFTNCFCRRCGARLPRYLAALGVVMIPAGSLDNEPSLVPEGRIFWDSRARWSCGADELPVYAEYPPGIG